ncbi:MAG: Ig-like domain-containing protein, partial [Planctomycetia bacterium]
MWPFGKRRRTETVSRTKFQQLGLRQLRCEPLEDRRMLSVIYGPQLETELPAIPVLPRLALYATTASAAPTAVDLCDTSDTGLSNADDWTYLDNRSPEQALQFEVSGTSAGALVTLYADGIAIGTALASGTITTITTDGNFDLADGIRSITATQTTPASTESDHSAPLSVTIDTEAPLQDSHFVSKLLADDGELNDQFGYSVDIDGTIAIVGAVNGANDDGIESGSAYIFEQTDTGWVQVAKLNANDGDFPDNFGCSVAISGTTVIVGAKWNENHGYFTSGAAYIFEQTENGWEQVAKLGDDVTAYDNFGCSVAISGNMAIVGAEGDNQLGSPTGSAYIFEKTDSGWIQVEKLMANIPEYRDYFGHSVSIDGDLAVVGAYGKDDKTGAIYIFEQTDTGWVQIFKDTGDQASDKFGSSVSVSDITVFVGASEDHNLATNTKSGSGCVFRKTDTGWRSDEVYSNDGENYDNFGCSVSVNGDVAIVGAYLDNDNGIYSGSAYLFRPTTNFKWTQVEKLVAPDGEEGDHFGYSVSICGDTIFVGAFHDDDNGDYSGSVYVFTTTPKIDLQSASDHGPSDVDNITNDNTPTFDITATPYYRVYRDGVQVSGDYETASTYTSAPLPDGTYDYTIIAVDEAGNETASSYTVRVTIDTVAPAVLDTMPDLQAASDLGPSDTDNLTCDNTPTFDVPGEVYFRLYCDGVQISGDYEFGSYTASLQSDGSHDYAVTVVDLAGNESALGDPLPVTIETVAPPTPTIAPDLQAASDTGISDSDNVTGDATPTFDISVSGYYHLYRDNVLVSGNCETASSYTPSLQPDGTYDYTIVAVDEAGNESLPSPAVCVTIDTVAPLQDSHFVAKLLADDGAENDGFGENVAVDGNIMVVGSPNDENENGDTSGSAYIFELTEVGWTQVTKLTAEDEEHGALFGGS